MESRKVIGRSLAWGVVTILCAFGVAFGLKLLERRVLKSKTQTGPRVAVKFSAHPGWMPEALAREIADALAPRGMPLGDPAVTQEVFRLAEANPWVRQVHYVSRHRFSGGPDGCIEVAAEFRRPIARVLAKDGSFCYVDAEGCVLPELQVPRWVVIVPAHDGRPASQTCYLSSSEIPRDQGLAEIHYVTIRGVETDPPRVGRLWKGDDLAEGLRLVELINTRDYANQITTVDVRNHRGRISRNEPFLRMYAQITRGRRTDIRFGRFPALGGDYVISPERKLLYLDDYVAANGGRLAGVNEYLDLRYDQLHVSIN